jgi:hypothetical protein
VLEPEAMNASNSAWRNRAFEIKGGKHRILATVEKENTLVPPACKFAAA